MGAIITADTLLQLLTHEEGGLKNTLQGAKRVVLLNQADTSELQSIANGMVPSLLPFYQAVLITSISEQKIYAAHEPIAGIILAAGASSRFGESKQLLDWHGQPFVRAVARTALEAGLSPVIVITGANSERVEAAVRDLDVKVIHNSDWETGQASSIKAGTLALQNVSAGGAIFLLADQPQITTSVLRALVEKHAAGLFSIVAPMVMDQRANPVLFDRITFKDLMSIEGDVGGRAIFHKHRVEYLPWHDDRLLLDVDTPEMYQRLITDNTL
jgi:molybdenum cofactor cytidylyltransferase